MPTAHIMSNEESPNHKLNPRMPPKIAPIIKLRIKSSIAKALFCLRHIASLCTAQSPTLQLPCSLTILPISPVTFYSFIGVKIRLFPNISALYRNCLYASKTLKKCWHNFAAYRMTFHAPYLRLTYHEYILGSNTITMPIEEKRKPRTIGTHILRGISLHSTASSGFSGL